MHRKHTSELLNRRLHFRIPEQDYLGFCNLAEFHKVSPGRLVRHLLRENYLGQSDPLPDQMKGMREAVYQLAAAGRNLNQLARAANSGQGVDHGSLHAVLLEIEASLARMSAELKTCMSRRRRLEPLEPRAA